MNAFVANRGIRGWTRGLLATWQIQTQAKALLKVSLAATDMRIGPVEEDLHDE
jgi:hypothetical protein